MRNENLETQPINKDSNGGVCEFCSIDDSMCLDTCDCWCHEDKL